MVMPSAEAVVLRLGDRARRERFMDRFVRSGWCEGIDGVVPSGGGFVAVVNRPGASLRVSVCEFVEQGPAVLGVFEVQNGGRLVGQGRFLVAFMVGGVVTLGVGVWFGSRELAAIEARFSGVPLLFDVVSGVQVFA